VELPPGVAYFASSKPHDADVVWQPHAVAIEATEQLRGIGAGAGAADDQPLGLEIAQGSSNGGPGDARGRKLAARKKLLLRCSRGGPGRAPFRDVELRGGAC
jgi:hypothetical protein